MVELVLQTFSAFGMLLWFGWWSANAGRSIQAVSPELDDWQDLKSWGSEVPELTIALTFGVIAAIGWGSVFDLAWYYDLLIFVASTGLSYIGKQSATWAYLNWEGHKNPSTDRSSSTRVWNDWLAAKLGYKLGDEGYSWVWAFTKGLITTFCVGGLGCVFQPIGREIASHAKGRLPFESNFWMESVGDGIGYTGAAFTFLTILSFI